MVDLQGAACAVAVLCAKRLPLVFMDEMLRGFSSSPIPHYFIVKALGDFAAKSRMN